MCVCVFRNTSKLMIKLYKIFLKIPSKIGVVKNLEKPPDRFKQGMQMKHKIQIDLLGDQNKNQIQKHLLRDQC